MEIFCCRSSLNLRGKKWSYWPKLLYINSLCVSFQNQSRFSVQKMICFPKIIIFSQKFWIKTQNFKNWDRHFEEMCFFFLLFLIICNLLAKQIFYDISNICRFWTQNGRYDVIKMSISPKFFVPFFWYFVIRRTI